MAKWVTRRTVTALPPAEVGGRLKLSRPGLPTASPAPRMPRMTHRWLRAAVGSFHGGREGLAHSHWSCGNKACARPLSLVSFCEEETMHGVVYLVGLVVVILAILSFFGLR
jgi:hypothetical protein